nr:hypothetical protein TorRG33x02_286950 [Ipomoea batatas]
MAGNGEMSNPSFLFDHVPFTQKSFGEFIFHDPVHVVNEHVGFPVFPVPGDESGGVNGGHPPWRLVVVPRRRVHHYQIPLYLVHLLRQPLQRQPAFRRSWVADDLAIVPSPRFQELVRLRAVLLEENRPAAVVKGGPHEAIMAEAEDQEVAGGLLLQHPHRHRDFLHRLLGSDVGGHVVHQRVGQRRRDLAAALGPARRQRGGTCCYPCCGGGVGAIRLGVRRPLEFDRELTSPFCMGSPCRRPCSLEPDLENELGPFAAASNALLHSSPGEGPGVLGLSAHNN